MSIAPRIVGTLPPLGDTRKPTQLGGLFNLCDPIGMPVPKPLRHGVRDGKAPPLDENAILQLTAFCGEGSVMDTSDSWRVVCQDPGDGSGDVIVELPSELLEKLGWTLGDELAIEKKEERISLKLKQRTVNTPS